MPGIVQFPSSAARKATKLSLGSWFLTCFPSPDMLQTEFVATTMHSYRAYLLDADGHIIDRIDLTCGDYESAKARARELM